MLKIFGLNFHLYGLLIGVGVWSAYEVSRWYAKRQKVGAKVVDQLLLWAVIPGIVGARLYHVADLWPEYYSLQPIKGLYVWEGGLAIWGAIIGGLAGLYIWKKIYKVDYSFLKLSDITLIGVPLAQAIGRWGNYFNGEIVGPETQLPWGIIVDGVKVHPLFLYESLLNFSLFVILVWLVKSKKIWKSGSLSGVYLVGYGAIRLTLEGMRDSTDVWDIGGLSVASMLGGMAIMVGAWIIKKPRG